MASEKPTSQLSYKPASTYSPTATIPNDDAETVKRKIQGATGDKAAETSPAERRHGDGLQFGDDEENTAGGNRK